MYCHFVNIYIFDCYLLIFDLTTLANRIKNLGSQSHQYFYSENSHHIFRTSAKKELVYIKIYLLCSILVSIGVLNIIF